MDEILIEIGIRAEEKAEKYICEFLNNDYDLLTTYVKISNEYERVVSVCVMDEDYESYYFESRYLRHILNRLQMFITRRYLRENGYVEKTYDHRSEWIKA